MTEASSLVLGLVFPSLLWGFVIGFITALAIFLTINSKSIRYRRLLTDMYVVGKLKQYAKDEGIDLYRMLSEYKNLSKILRESPTRIDKSIENEISEKIGTINKELES